MAEIMLHELVHSACLVIARTLRALPRVTEPDGSRWVSADLLDDMANKLEAPPNGPDLSRRTPQ